MATTKITKKQQAEQDRQAAIEYLQRLYPVGSTVSTVMTHVSQSGMLRTFRVVRGLPNGEVQDLTRRVATAGGFKLHRNGDIAMGGCGMDMGFALVYSLSRSLWPEGHPCTGVQYGGHGQNDGAARCPSNDHTNERGDDYAAGFNTSRVHSNGGYALNHRHV